MTSEARKEKICELCGEPLCAHENCPDCGYTYCDVLIHGDHHLCGGPQPKPPHGFKATEAEAEFICSECGKVDCAEHGKVNRETDMTSEARKDAEERGYKHPCFECGFDRYEEVQDCLERTEDVLDCLYLIKGGGWDTCDSGKHHITLSAYRRWQNATNEFIMIPIPKGWSRDRWRGEVRAALTRWFSSKKRMDAHGQKICNDAILAITKEDRP